MGIIVDWQRVERWLSADAPEVLARLPAGASDIALVEAEATLGFALPPELRESLSVHDGNDEAFELYRPDGVLLGSLLPLRDMIEGWESLAGAYGDGHNDSSAMPLAGVKRRWFHRLWIPILGGLGDYACIDLDPARGGKRGQVIDWAHDGGPLEIVATSYSDLFSSFTRDLEAGRYVKANRHGQVFLDLLNE